MTSAAVFGDSAPILSGKITASMSRPMAHRPPLTSAKISSRRT
jgi:hypothetical protein